MRTLLTRLLVLGICLLGGVHAVLAERVTTFYHTDGLGSVVAATGATGTVLWRKSYTPYGAQIGSSHRAEPLSYTGKPHDNITGLTYFGARYFDPEVGRFISVDPVGFVESNPMSFNRYLYVNNNPYKYVDPDGEFLNFAAKFVLDVGINVAFNYVTTGQMDVGGALKESAVGILNPAKTVAKAGKLAMALAKSKKATSIAGEAVQNIKKSDDVIHVTKSGIALPPGPKHAIPGEYAQNPHRSGNYGEVVGGKYVERLRIDPPTPPGNKGPNYSHYHLNGKDAHYSPKPGDKDPGFKK